MAHHRNIYQKERGERWCSATLIVSQGLNRTLDHVLITLFLDAGIASVDPHTLPVPVLNCHTVFMYTVMLELSAPDFLVRLYSDKSLLEVQVPGSVLGSSTQSPALWRILRLAPLLTDTCYRSLAPANHHNILCEAI